MSTPSLPSSPITTSQRQHPPLRRSKRRRVEEPQADTPKPMNSVLATVEKMEEAKNARFKPKQEGPSTKKQRVSGPTSSVVVKKAVMKLDPKRKPLKISSVPSTSSATSSTTKKSLDLQFPSFGTEEWNTFFNQKITDAPKPPLCDDSFTTSLLKKGIKQLSGPILIPGKVGLMPYTLNRLDSALKKLGSESTTKIEAYNPLLKKALGDKPLSGTPYYVCLTERLPAAKDHLRPPKTLEMATATLASCLQNKTRPFVGTVPCEETLRNRQLALVSVTPSGISMNAGSARAAVDVSPYGIVRV